MGTCFKCGVQGHRASECSWNRMENYYKGVELVTRAIQIVVENNVFEYHQE